MTRRTGFPALVIALLLALNVAWAIDRGVAWVSDSVVTTHDAVAIASGDVSIAATCPVTQCRDVSLWASTDATATVVIQASPDGTNWTTPSAGATLTFTTAGDSWLVYMGPVAPYLRAHVTNPGTLTATVTTKLVRQ